MIPGPVVGVVVAAARMLSVVAAVCGVQLLAVAAAWMLRRREQMLMRLLPYLVSVAVGVLLATALLHLLPESVAALGNGQRVPLLLGGTIVSLFALERVISGLSGTPVEQPEARAMLRAHEAAVHGSEASQGTHHHHHGTVQECAGAAEEHGRRPTRPGNLLLASGLHSLVDGATIAAAFIAGPRTGWLAATAVMLHEVPHRMGDFALLVQLRVPLRRALEFAGLAGLPALVGMGLVLLFGGVAQGAVQTLLPVSAGSFLYVALVNLLPELQVECRRGRVLGQLLSLLGGVLLVMLTGALPES